MKLKLPKINFFKPKTKKILALDEETFSRNKFFLKKKMNITCFLLGMSNFIFIL